jgi:hypothetical protein
MYNFVSIKRVATLIESLVVLFVIIAASPVSARDLIDYFLPTPIHDKLETNVWGNPGVIPRDIHNGIEDPACTHWMYWEGKIFKAPNNKYHLFNCRWPSTKGHWGVVAAGQCIHGVSDNVLGPYIDIGPAYEWMGGKGQNVTGVRLLDGRYALLVSGNTVPTVHIANDPNGPWVYQGQLIGYGGDNISMCESPDGSFIIVGRSGRIATSTKANGILGPYVTQDSSIWPTNLPDSKIWPGTLHHDNNWEDPCIWRSGNRYHIVVNDWSTREAAHLISNDGVHDWYYAGIAWNPRTDFVHYTDGTVNHWWKIEQPNVHI